MTKKISPEECKLSEDVLDLPSLVLAVHKKYDLPEGREWLAVNHRTGGRGYHNNYMILTVLQPREEMVDKIKQISGQWDRSDCGVFGVTLNEILFYRKHLKELFGLDCNKSYHKFEAGIYPIDCSYESVRKLAVDELPSLNGMTFEENKNGFETISYKKAGGRWNLYILGENHD